MENDTECNVLVVGAGMAGLSAALSAAQAGGRVTVLERGDRVGGSMAISGGLIWAPRDLETARARIPKGSPVLQKKLVEELPSGWEWLVANGIPLTAAAPCLKDDFGVGRMMEQGHAGNRYGAAAAMQTAAEEAGAAFSMDSTVERLTRQANGGWLAHVAIGSRHESLHCDAIVFSAGGFQNDTSLMRRYISVEAESMGVRSNRHSNGVAIHLLRPHGAALSGGLSSFYGHSMPWTPSGRIDPEVFIPAAQYYSDYCVILNQYGLRFTDESMGILDEHNAQQGSRQPGAVYFLLFDERIRRQHVAGALGLPIVASQIPDRLALVEELGGVVLKSESLSGLANMLDDQGVPANNALNTLNHYNRLEDAPRGSFFPPRVADHVALTEPPFYAVKCVSAITSTMGGLAVDDSCRVLGESGTPMDGIYAAGVDAGGIFHDVYGGGLAWAVVSGREAGLQAARLLD